MAAEASAADAARRNADAALRDLTIGVRLKEELIKTLAHSAVEAEQAVAKCVGSSNPVYLRDSHVQHMGVGCYTFLGTFGGVLLVFEKPHQSSFTFTFTLTLTLTSGMHVC
jgi:hypothetical protein